MAKSVLGNRIERERRVTNEKPWKSKRRVVIVLGEKWDPLKI